MHNGVIQFDPNTTTAAHRLLGQSQDRMYLTIYPPASGTATIANTINVAADQGITLSAGMAPLYFDYDFHGDCLQREWYVIYSAGGHPVSFIETLCYRHETTPNTVETRKRPVGK